jgi:hypothetical protein
MTTTKIEMEGQLTANPESDALVFLGAGSRGSRDSFSFRRCIATIAVQATRTQDFIASVHSNVKAGWPRGCRSGLRGYRP